MNLQALHKLCYGIYVICSRKGDKLNGQIANSVFQVTSEPPIVAVSINRKNLTNEYIKDSKVFTVSVLCQDTPLPFIGHFGFKSGRDGDKLPGIGYKTGVTGAPVVLENAVSYFEAKVIQEIDVLTHTIFIGEITGAELVADKVTMTYDYYQQVKRGKTPAAAPSYIAPEKKEIIPVTDKTDKYVCKICGYIYDPAIGDPDSGIKPGTSFADLPADWSCPVCGADKSQFEKAI